MSFVKKMQGIITIFYLVSIFTKFKYVFFLLKIYNQKKKSTIFLFIDHMVFNYIKNVESVQHMLI